uniref:Uncharacterized protein n=1 Tax=Lactuca sativa TaxID=4236 RepID=A0A9R1UQM6_LACSA|nr:hypothetical protein LSAT_V11C800418270 [Lactuca sativa]
MLLKKLELELEKESVRNLNPIPYAVWLAGNGIGINSRFCLVRRKWKRNSLVVRAVAVVAATVVGGDDDGGGIDCGDESGGDGGSGSWWRQRRR